MARIKTHPRVVTEDGRIGWPSVVEYEYKVCFPNKAPIVDDLAYVFMLSPVSPIDGTPFITIIHDQATYDYNERLGVFRDPRHCGPVKGIKENLW